MTHLSPHLGLERRLNEQFDGVFDSGRLGAFMAFAQQVLPSLVPIPDPHPVEALVIRDTSEVLPERAQLHSGQLTLVVTRELGIRLVYQGQQVTTDTVNIPFHYPWFCPDPTDQERVAEFAAKHVARGTRADTWPEDQWPQVGGVKQGEQNWPPRSVAFGPYNLMLLTDGPARAISVTLPPDSTGRIAPNAYGVIPRGLFSVTPEGQVLLAWQNDNQSELGLHWAAWLILGFAMPKVAPSYHNPSVIFAFPDDESPDPVTNRMGRVWNYYEVEGQTIALINPHIKTLNEPFKKFYRNTNWAMVAVKGADHVIVARSILQHEEQFFPFLEHGAYFIEAEFTGPRVPPGEKSTVLSQYDFLSVHRLTQGSMTRLSTEDGLFERDVLAILRCLIQAFHVGNVSADS